MDKCKEPLNEEMKTKNLLSIPNNSAGTLTSAVANFPTGNLIQFKEIKEKTRHLYLTYEQFPFSMHIQDGTLIWHR